MARNKGKEFENLAAEIYTKLIGNSKFESIETDVKIDLGEKGTYQFDVVLRTKTAGIELMTVIECKDYKRPIDREFIGAFYEKMKDVKANKGIIVTSKGYRQSAKFKAQQLGISLYTAHQARHPKWGIDIEVPVVVQEIHIRHFSPVIRFHENVRTKWEMSKTQILINDVDVFNLFKKQWEANEIDFATNEYRQEIKLRNFDPPYYVRDAFGNQIDAASLTVELQLKIHNYLGFLNELDNVQLLKSLSNEMSTIFIDTLPIIKNYRNTFKKVAEIPTFDKVQLNLTMRYEMPNKDIKYFAIKEDRITRDPIC